MLKAMSGNVGQRAGVIVNYQLVECNKMTISHYRVDLLGIGYDDAPEILDQIATDYNFPTGWIYDGVNVLFCINKLFEGKEQSFEIKFRGRDLNVIIL